MPWWSRTETTPGARGDASSSSRTRAAQAAKQSVRQRAQAHLDPSVSRRDAAAAVAAAALAAVPFAPLHANAVGTCPPNAQNCWSSASSDKTKVPAWTSGKSQKDAAADVKAVIDAYPQAGQEKVDLGGWSYTEDAILTSGAAKLEFKSGIGNFAKFLNGGKPFVDDLELQLSGGGLAVTAPLLMRARLLMLASLARAFRAPAARNVRSSLRAVATEEKPPFYCTTPIYYVNAAPHIGHAYTSVACDAAVRFAKLDGRRAMLVTGTDEHGEKVEESAKAKGVAPLDFATEVSATFRDLAESFDVDFDRFVRTTEPAHARAVEKLWKALEANGMIYLGSYEGWYCAPTGADVEWKAKEPSYFFKLSAFREKLIDLYEGDEARRPKSRRARSCRS
ncbi:hypothetical protein JL720_16448 [Aureococcus anophagefferens]|nr:hypothetical protein JL720_16448 [Aureococcus anophagefferens]